MSRSGEWLRRQGRDPFVQERIKRGLNSRSAFKLEQLDEKLKFIQKNKRIVDLGACPGGWTQILIERGIKDIVAVDLREPPNNLKDKVKFIVGDFTLPETKSKVLDALGNNPADLILSDMAPNSTGDRNRDHYLSMHLLRAALDFSDQVLDKQNGAFLCKVFSGEEEADFGKEMKSRFKEFKRIKPDASRKESRELFFFGRNSLSFVQGSPKKPSV